MNPFTTVSGPAAPLMRQNVDIDIMIRIEYLMDLDDAALGAHCFEVWRYRDDGSENPDFVFNQAPWRNAPILLAGSNFGCGSSREGAVTAIAAMGIRVVIAPSFGVTFYNNCIQNRLLPIQLESDVVDNFANIARATPEAPFEVNLHTKLVTPPDADAVAFDMDEMRRQGLLQGLDDLGLTLKRVVEIDDYQQQDATRRPWGCLDKARAHPIHIGTDRK